MGGEGSGRPVSPRAEAECLGVDIWAVIAHYEQAEVSRLERDKVLTAKVIEAAYRQARRLIYEATTVGDVLAVLAAQRDELARIHAEHYDTSIASTHAQAGLIRGYVAEAQRVGLWYRPGARLPEVPETEMGSPAGYQLTLQGVG